MTKHAKKPESPAKARILIVDDEEGVITTFVDFLTASGYEATGYTDAQEALQALNSFSPDLVLLDIMMPRVDGYEFCRLMKQTKGNETIPVVFVSGKDWEDDAMLSAKEGGALFISKPVPFNELKEIVELAIQGQF